MAKYARIFNDKKNKIVVCRARPEVGSTADGSGRSAIQQACRQFEGEHRVVPAVGGRAYWVPRSKAPPASAEHPQLAPVLSFFLRARFPVLSDLESLPGGMTKEEARDRHLFPGALAVGRAQFSRPDIGRAVSTLCIPDEENSAVSWSLDAEVMSLPEMFWKFRNSLGADEVIRLWNEGCVIVTKKMRGSVSSQFS